ncbi:metallophosphoesterase, partial [Metabacillus sp. 84]|uniref:metallophosphoesterase n=1 Tax=Metabacillus sp. 84 TaxID=3404705 RepID=UPI003CF54BE9
MVKIDVIGDVHGCFRELNELIKKLGYIEKEGVPVHPNGRKLSFVGDLTDRGPDSLKVIEKVARIVQSGTGFYSPGNHCDKLYRFSERESPFLQVWDESEVGYGVPLKTVRFVVLQVSEMFCS